MFYTFIFNAFVNTFASIDFFKVSKHAFDYFVESFCDAVKAQIRTKTLPFECNCPKPSNRIEEYNKLVKFHKLVTTGSAIFVYLVALSSTVFIVYKMYKTRHTSSINCNSNKKRKFDDLVNVETVVSETSIETDAVSTLKPINETNGIPFVSVVPKSTVLHPLGSVDRKSVV